MTPPEADACERANARLDERCGDGLDDARDAHLASCEACRALAELDRLLRSEPVPEPPPDLRAAIVASVHADARRSRWRALAPALVPVAAAAVAAVVTLSGLDLVGGLRGVLADAIDLAHLGRDQLPAVAVPELPPMPFASFVPLAAAAALLLLQVAWFRRRATR